MNKFWHRGHGFRLIAVLLPFIIWATWGAVFVPARAVGNGGATAEPDLERADWLLLGPLPNPVTSGAECIGFGKDYLTVLGGEAAAQPRSGRETGKLRWLACRAEAGFIDLQRILGPTSQSVAYAYTEFQARPQQAALKLGSDDGIKVWLNGRLVWENHSHRSLQRDADAVLVNLKSGTNRLLFKIDQGSGDWGFTARFLPPASEKAGWSHALRPAYRFVLHQDFIVPGRAITGYVATVPSYAVAEEVRVMLSDATGKSLASQTALTGSLVSIPLPGKFLGECRIRIVGTGPRANVSSAPASIYCGDVEILKRQTAAKARRLARLLADTNRAADPKATLYFLANQLEGQVHPSLCTTARTIRALRAIHEIEQKIAAIAAPQKGNAAGGRKSASPSGAWAGAGVHQWAYRSAIDASYQPYSLYLPQNYDVSRKYSLLICLHGYSGDDYGAVEQALTGTAPDDFIVAAPFGRGDLAYRSLGEQDVLDVIELLKRSYTIDPDRVYLTGWSMGGCGAWRIGQFYADRFAAVAPFCGWTGPDYLENLRNTPLLIVHGTGDTTVPAAMDRAAYDRLRDWGYPVRYDELPGVGHDAWDAWIKNRGAGQFYRYLRRFRRNPWPERAVAATAHLRYGKAYWLQITELEKPLVKGVVDAAILDSRHVRVSTVNVKSFVLNLSHPKLAQSGRVLLEINGYSLAVDAGQAVCALDFSAREQRFLSLKNKNNGELKPQQTVARHDGGGLADLFTAPLLVVYDSRRDAPAHQKAARIMADWSASQFFAGTKVGKFTVKSDREIRKADLKNHNLLVFGSDETLSRLIPDWYRKTPLDFYNQTVQIGRRRFERTGLLMVFPNPRAPSCLLGLISLPFGEQDYLDFITRLQLRIRAYGLEGDDTASFITPDVMVLKSPTQIVWSGSFDSRWRILRKIDYN